MGRRFLILLTAIALLQACTGSPAPPDSSCPDGMVVHPMWQGEYPAPVIHVLSQVELSVYAGPCDPFPKGTCLLEPGIFHPWGEGEEFITLRPVEPYRARERFTLGDREVSAGEIVEVTGYLAENICAWKVREKAVNTECLFEDNYPLDPLATLPVGEFQFFRAGCAGWILVDDALFDRPEISRGTILEYGKVGPDDSPLSLL